VCYEVVGSFTLMVLVWVYRDGLVDISMGICSCYLEQRYTKHGGGWFQTSLITYQVHPNTRPAHSITPPPSLSFHRHASSTPLGSQTL
jgi:hypothetical protein